MVMQEVEYVHKIERKIRQKLANKGLVAKNTFENICAESPALSETVRIAKQYAIVNSSVLISGETGTGKEMFAQSIHNFSSRRNEAFVAVNCATIPANLLESELFGYVEGAFTGAKRGGKIGLLSLPIRAPFFSMKSERPASTCRPGFCECWRNTRSCALATTRSSL